MGCQRCMCCFRAAKWLPVIFIVAVVVWSYYAYVIQLCLFTVPNILEKVLYLLFYHVAFAMFCWAYWQTIFAEVGRVPKQFRIASIDAEKLEKELTTENQHRFLEHLARDLPVSNRTDHNSIRYCEKCHIVKPDRAHHCSVCGECVLKMDHHCPWVNNCVNFNNYKFFILFLGYSLVYCVYVASTTLQYFVKFWKNELSDVGRFHILFLFFVSVMFAFSLVSLFSYHCYLVSVNRSTLESFRAPIFRTGPDKDGFSLGKFNNFLEVFGDNKRNWFLPVFSSLGDGIVFPTRTPQGNSYNSMGSTVPSMGDGVTFPERRRREDTEGLLGHDGRRWPESGEVDSCSEQENPPTNGHLSADTRLIVD